MKITTKPPTDGLILVSRRAAQGSLKMCELWRTLPVQVGEAQYNQQSKTWVTDTGIQLRQAKDVINYYEERLATQGTPLAPGTYSADVVSVSQTADRVVLRTAQGTEIVIKIG